MNPKISVIIPTYYRNELLREAIESVLGQEYDPVELIVVDDSGEGHARPVIEEYDDVQGIVREQNGGWAAANTTGIEASTGEYIQLLDDDDYLLAGKLTKTAKVLQENPEVGVSYCGVIRGEKGDFYPKPDVSGNILEQALHFGTFPLWTGSMLMEREVLEDCMPLAGMAEDDDLDIELGDTDLKIRLAQRTTFDYVDECLVFYRQETNNRWCGPRRFRKVKQNVQHQQELYDQYPEIREDLLAAWYKRQGFYWLGERFWSSKAIVCLLKSTYHETNVTDKVKTSILTAASLFGRPGLNATYSLRSSLLGTQGDVRLESS
jgi:glycosyltransferase involved in cell wall biosynthesis